MSYLAYTVTTDAASEPLTKVEVRLQLKNEGITADDDLLDIYIKSARQLVEKKTSTAILPKTITQIFNDFPTKTEENPYASFELAVSPLVSVTSITWKDTAGDPFVVTSTNYDTNTIISPGLVAPIPTYNWPTGAYQGLNAITIIYIAGYADTTAMPSPLREAMFLTIAHWYKNRVDSPRQLSTQAEWILKDYRVSKY